MLKRKKKKKVPTPNSLFNKNMVFFLNKGKMKIFTDKRKPGEFVFREMYYQKY